VPGFYSPEWVAAFNEAVADLDVATGDTATLRSGRGNVAVAYAVTGGPTGDFVVTLVVEDGKLTMVRSGSHGDGVAASPDVTVSLSYEDAVAMSRGAMDPAAAMGLGRVRVRGDLAVLGASQALLASAGERLADLRASTTY
jgi:hypothetical protein